MKIDEIRPPRVFTVGKAETELIHLKDCAHITLAPDEQVTFHTESGGEYDVVRKSWGFFATPSLDGRLLQFRLHAAIIRSPGGRYFTVLVEEGKEAEFQRYADLHSYVIVAWMDSTVKLDQMAKKMGELR